MAFKKTINKDKILSNQNLNSHGIYIQFDERKYVKSKGDDCWT